jgi:hypothetical protein
MAWFYEAMSEFEMEFDYKPTYSNFISLQETEEEATEFTIKLFEHHIETAFKDWTIYKVFGHERGDRKYELYCEVWEFLRDVAIGYSQKHPNVVITEKNE